MASNPWSVRGHLGCTILCEVLTVSIIRIGLAETKKFAEGYEAIFGPKKKKDAPATQAKSAGSKKSAKGGKKKGKK